MPVLWRPQSSDVEDSWVCGTAAEHNRHSSFPLPSMRYAIPYAPVGSQKLEVCTMSWLSGNRVEPLVGALLQCVACRALVGGNGRHAVPLRGLPAQLRQFPRLQREVLVEEAARGCPSRYRHNGTEDSGLIGETRKKRGWFQTTFWFSPFPGRHARPKHGGYARFGFALLLPVAAFEPQRINAP